VKDERFEWDDQKAWVNAQKHGVTFEEATDVFDPGHALVGYDHAHSAVEDRFMIHRETMKKTTTADHDDEMPAEFDFSNAIPNPYFVAMHGPAYVRVIDKDLADFFPDDVTMNAALRTIAEAGKRAVPQKRSARTAAAPKSPAKKKARS
jgi:hypothetical protein